MPNIHYISQSQTNEGKQALEKLGKPYELLAFDDLSDIASLKLSLVVFEVCANALEAISELEKLQKKLKKNSTIVCVHLCNSPTSLTEMKKKLKSSDSVTFSNSLEALEENIDQTLFVLNTFEKKVDKIDHFKDMAFGSMEFASAMSQIMQLLEKSAHAGDKNHDLAATYF